MIRRTIRMVALALVAVFGFGAMADAAPKKAVHHRARHSTRVASRPAASEATKKTPLKRRTASKKRTAAKKTSASRRPATKPR
jgi:hypothetical protein